MAAIMVGMAIAAIIAAATDIEEVMGIEEVTGAIIAADISGAAMAGTADMRAGESFAASIVGITGRSAGASGSIADRPERP